MGALLALGAAICFGIADFAGGLLSRRANGAAVALAVQVSGLILLLLVAPLIPAAGVGVHDLGWGALSGIGTAVGVLFLYRGLTHGQMSVVVPLSTVGGVVLPLLVGVALLGDRPSALAWLGIIIAVPALALVSRAKRSPQPAVSAGVADGLVSSVGFALQYIGLAQAGAAAGLWPVASGRVASVLTILMLAKVISTQLSLPRRLIPATVANGAIAALALVLYMLATRQELVAVAVVLASLYPAIPVLLGITALRERLTRQQIAGLAGAGAAIGLLTAG